MSAANIVNTTNFFRIAFLLTQPTTSKQFGVINF